jgi:hypothetical protein
LGQEKEAVASDDDVVELASTALLIFGDAHALAMMHRLGWFFVGAHGHGCRLGVRAYPKTWGKCGRMREKQRREEWHERIRGK